MPTYLYDLPDWPKIDGTWRIIVGGKAGDTTALGQERFDPPEVNRQDQSGEKRCGGDGSLAHRGVIKAA